LWLKESRIPVAGNAAEEEIANASAGLDITGGAFPARTVEGGTEFVDQGRAIMIVATKVKIVRI